MLTRALSFKSARLSKLSIILASATLVAPAAFAQSAPQASNDPNALSKDLDPDQCPATVSVSLSDVAVTAQRRLAKNAEFVASKEALADSGAVSLTLERTSASKKACVYESVDGAATKASARIDRRVDFNPGHDDSPAYYLWTRLSLRIDLPNARPVFGFFALVQDSASGAYSADDTDARRTLLVSLTDVASLTEIGSASYVLRFE